MNIKGLTSIGIQEGTLSPISCFISNSTQVLFCLNNHFSLVLLTVMLHWFDFFYSDYLFYLYLFIFSFFLFSLYLSFFILFQFEYT